MTNALRTESHGDDYSMEQFLEDIITEAVNHATPKDLEILGHRTLTLSPEEAKEEYRKSLHVPIEEEKIAERYKKGLEIIKQHLGEYPNDRLCLQELEKADKIQGSSLEPSEPTTTSVVPSSNIDYRLYAEAMAKNPTPQNESEGHLPLALQWKLSPETVATFYNIGVKLYEEGKYEDAICVFTYLSIINHYSHEVWVSLGLCHMRAKEWIPAVQAFTTANFMDPRDPIPYLYNIDCYVALHNKDYAELALDMSKYFITDENKEGITPLVENYQNLMLQN